MLIFTSNQTALTKPSDFSGGVFKAFTNLIKNTFAAVYDPLEIRAIREACGKDFVIVTPGIRPAWSTTDDQKRITTPKPAVEKGTDYLVVGRPIIQADKYNLTRKEAAKKM